MIWSAKLLATGVNFIKVLLAKAGKTLLAVVEPPQPGSMGKANMDARPKPPRKTERREGLLRALSRTSWKCSLLDVLSMGSNVLDMKGWLRVDGKLNLMVRYFIYVTVKLA
jgi:hypothetical protein